MFSRKERVKGGPPDAPSSLSTADKSVHTYINGKLEPQVTRKAKHSCRHRPSPAPDLPLCTQRTPPPHPSRVKTNTFGVYFCHTAACVGVCLRPCLLTLRPPTNTCVCVFFMCAPSTQLYLRVRADGFCTFPDGRLQPADDALVALAENGSLVDGVNSVRFEIRCVQGVVDSLAS